MKRQRTITGVSVRQESQINSVARAAATVVYKLLSRSRPVKSEYFTHMAIYVLVMLIIPYLSYSELR